MPELPEVETTLRGISPHLTGITVTGLNVRDSRLRYPVADDLSSLITGQRVQNLHRRGKYLLLEFSTGYLMIHLGMSGSLRLVPAGTTPGLHDHIDLGLASGQTLRYTDPRRFGLWLWCEDPSTHRLIRHLGPEPLSDAFDSDYLWRRSRGKRVAIKSFVMDSRIVVGVGNIYANEALFLAGIHPTRPAGRVSRERYTQLQTTIREVLKHAIDQGGTTLRDFVGGDGKPGYFSQSLNVYGRVGQPCPRCKTALRERRLSNRSTVYCPACQR